MSDGPSQPSAHRLDDQAARARRHASRRALLHADRLGGHRRPVVPRLHRHARRLRPHQPGDRAERRDRRRHDARRRAPVHRFKQLCQPLPGRFDGRHRLRRLRRQPDRMHADRTRDRAGVRILRRPGDIRRRPPPVPREQRRRQSPAARYGGERDVRRLCRQPHRLHHDHTGDRAEQRGGDGPQERPPLRRLADRQREPPHDQRHRRPDLRRLRRRPQRLRVAARDGRGHRSVLAGAVAGRRSPVLHLHQRDARQRGALDARRHREPGVRRLHRQSPGLRHDDPGGRPQRRARPRSERRRQAPVRGRQRRRCGGVDDARRGRHATGQRLRRAERLHAGHARDGPERCVAGLDRARRQPALRREFDQRRGEPLAARPRPAPRASRTAAAG